MPAASGLSPTPISASGVYSPRTMCDCSLVTTEQSCADAMEKPQGIHDRFITCPSLIHHDGWWAESCNWQHHHLSGRGHSLRKGGGLEERGEEALGR